MSFYFAKPRYERSNPMQNVGLSMFPETKYAQTGIDHTTRWRTIKPKTVIELCSEGKLERSAVQFVFDAGIITRGKLRAALISGLRKNPLALKIVAKYSGLVF